MPATARPACGCCCECSGCAARLHALGAHCRQPRLSLASSGAHVLIVCACMSGCMSPFLQARRAAGRHAARERGAQPAAPAAPAGPGAGRRSAAGRGRSRRGSRCVACGWCAAWQAWLMHGVCVCVCVCMCGFVRARCARFAARDDGVRRLPARPQARWRRRVGRQTGSARRGSGTRTCVVLAVALACMACCALRAVFLACTPSPPPPHTHTHPTPPHPTPPTPPTNPTRHQPPRPHTGCRAAHGRQHGVCGARACRRGGRGGGGG
jgi:hypothetical protein